MKKRKILIKSCDECPHVDYRGAFGEIPYIPCCTQKNKNLPYMTSISERGRNAMVTANGTGIIPD